MLACVLGAGRRVRGGGGGGDLFGEMMTENVGTWVMDVEKLGGMGPARMQFRCFM